MADKKIFVVDRFEESIAVCVSDDDDVVRMPSGALNGLRQNDVFSAIIDGEGLVDITPMPEERDRRQSDIRARLHALARRSKK